MVCRSSQGPLAISHFCSLGVANTPEPDDPCYTALDYLAEGVVGPGALAVEQWSEDHLQDGYIHGKPIIPKSLQLLALCRKTDDVVVME